MSIKLENYTEEGGIIFSIKNHKIASNAFLNVIKQICTLVFSLITFPYVSRILGDNNYGKYSFATAIIEYLLLFLCLVVEHMQYEKVHISGMTRKNSKYFLLRCLQ